MSDMGDVDDETKRLGVIGCLMVVAGLAASLAVGIGLGAAWGWGMVALWAVVMLARIAREHGKDER